MKPIYRAIVRAVRANDDVCVLFSWLEAIPKSTDADNMPRLGRIRFNLAAQLNHVSIHHTVRHENAAAPDLTDHLTSRDHATQVLQKQFEHLEFDGSKVHAAAGAAQFRASEIDLALADAAHGFSLRRGPAQQRADPGAEFARAERFGDVIVGAEVEPHHLLRFLRLRRQHQDGSSHLRAPQLPANFKAVFPRQHDVQKDEVPTGLASAQTGSFAVACDLDYISFIAQIELQAERDIGFILHNQNPRHL